MRRAGESGFAILAALWAAAFLAIAIGSILQISRSGMRLTDARSSRIRHDITTNAIVTLAVLRMLDPTPDLPPLPTDGTPVTMEFDGQTAQVSVQDEAGRIDLNHARPEVLRALLTSIGLDDDAASTLAQNILAWRQMPGHPAAPFRSVSELRLVTGTTNEIYLRLAPWLTVHTQTEWVDPSAAPMDVLRALATIDANALAALRLRTEQAAEQNSGWSSPGVALGRAFTINVKLMGARDPIATRTVIVRLTGNEAQPIAVYSWE